MVLDLTYSQEGPLRHPEGPAGAESNDGKSGTSRILGHQS